MDLKTTKLSLYVGGYDRASYAVRLTPAGLEYRTWASASAPQRTLLVGPSPEAWSQFWNDVDDLGVWEWAERYEDRSVAAGTDWGVDLQNGKRRVSSVGSNVYPPEGTGPEPTFEWHRFCQAVHRLLGEVPFG